MKYVSVALDLALDKPLAYAVPPALEGEVATGQLLRVPLRGRAARGFALEILDHAPDGVPPEKIKAVLSIEDPVPFFSKPLLDLAKWIADYTASPVETALRAAIPAAVLKRDARPREQLFVEPVENPKCEDPSTPKRRRLLEDIRRVGGGWLQQLSKEFDVAPSLFKALAKSGHISIAPRERRRNPLEGRTILPSKPLPLNAEQSAALETIRNSKRPVLLYGVTGSGKTEVYLQAIAGILAKGGGAIVMVPEIALTPQTVRRFASRFGETVAVLHSALSPGERYDEWRRIRRGEARVVVGPRSAVFAPVANLGLIVVDEEHDSSYKQDETPRYNARDTALVRARLEGAAAVLGSATPSLESWLNAKNGKFTLARIPHRVRGNPMPPVRLVDMNEEARRTGFAPLFSSELLEAIGKRLGSGEQTILFLNRRGFSRSLACPACGHVEKCPACDLAYTWHKADDCLRCHICGGWKRTPASCPECGCGELKRAGAGTQRAECALRKCFRHARILRMDADSVARKNSHDDILAEFRAGRADILLGTQMIAKGLDFPNVTLVGVLNADISLNLPDPRASERTFQLLAQVAGRAGRAELPGEVYVQTFSPEAPPVAAVARGCDFEPFAEAELSVRREYAFPPYMKMAVLTVRSEDESKAAAWAEYYSKALAAFAGKNSALSMNVSDASPSALAKADNRFRMQVTVRAPKNSSIVAAWKWIRDSSRPPADVRASIDIDALDFL